MCWTTSRFTNTDLDLPLLVRRFPEPHTYQASNEQVKLGMAMAYEDALRVLIDEFGADDEFHALFYGPQSEDPDQCHSLMGN